MNDATPKREAAPAALAAIFFLCGILLGARSGTGTGRAIALACGCALLLAVSARRSERGPAAILGSTIFWASLGFIEARARIREPAEEARRTFASLPSQRERSDRVEGVLTDFWSGSPPRVRGRMRAERIWKKGSWHPFRADVFIFLSGETPAERTADRGDRVTAVGHLNPEGISASERDLSLPWPVYRLSIKSAALLARQGPTVSSLLTLPNRWLHARLPRAGTAGVAFDRDVRGPLSALLLGRTADLERGMVARYRRGGLYHLLVVSGLHVALASGLAMLALRSLRVRGKPRDAVFLAVLLLFVLVGGGNPPAVRAGTVFGLHRAARLAERPIPNLQALGLSALILFGAQPAEIYSIGSVLTFSAVCGIALFTAPIRARLPARPSGLFSGLAAAPLLLWRFNLVSAGAWLTAPLAIPMLGGMIVLGSVLLLFFAVGLTPWPLVSLFAFGSRSLEFIAERAAGAAYLRPTPSLAAALAVSGLLLAAAFAPRRVRPAAIASAGALFLFLAVRRGPTGPERGFSLEALDVGQGDALLLRWNRHAVLVDGGGPFDLDQRDFGRTRLVPKLLDRGVTRLDAVVLTHPHPDHALGLFAVMEELPVGAFWRCRGDDEGGLFRDLDATARRRSVPVQALSAGESILWRDASLAVLHSGGPRRKLDGTNNQSLVLLFERDGRRALLPGDAGAATEGALLRDGHVPRADILKIGHHGSRGSTTPAFLEAVCPKAALLSCGRENRFGHPAPETLRTLGQAHVPVFRTDLDSDFRIDLLPLATRLKSRGLW
jgi:competence protein ComEC